MTAKRFTLTYEKIGKYFNMGIVDHETKQPFDDTSYEFHQCSFQDSKDEMEDLTQLLNELAEENEQLKQYKKALWDWNSSKIIRVNMNTGEVDLVDKELEE